MKGVKRFNIPTYSVPERRAVVVSVYMISNHCELTTHYLNSHSIRDCHVWLDMCCSCSEHMFRRLKQRSYCLVYTCTSTRVPILNAFSPTLLAATCCFTWLHEA